MSATKYSGRMRTDPMIGSRPNDRFRVSTVKAASIIVAAWARLMIFMTP